MQMWNVGFGMQMEDAAGHRIRDADAGCGMEDLGCRYGAGFRI